MNKRNSHKSNPKQKPKNKKSPAQAKQEKARKKLKEISKTAYVGDVISPIDVEWDSLK